MSRINEFGVCPICGQSDRLDITDVKTFNEVFEECGHNSIVTISCYRCDLRLSAHTRDYNTWNYQIMIGELKKKWLKLKQSTDEKTDASSADHTT